MPLSLVTGGTGFIGRYVVQELHRAGHEVRCLVRATSDTSGLAGLPVHLTRGDLTDPNTLNTAVAGVDNVFHLAGVIRAWRAADYESINGGGTLRLLQACERCNPTLRRFVLVSSVAAAGPSPDGRPLTEADPEHPSSEYGRSKRAGELAALAYADRVPLTIIRPSVVYGPGDRATLPLFRLANLGLCPILGDDARLSLVHASDVARGIVISGMHPAALGRTYFMSGPEAATIGELMRMIASALGRRALPVRLPYLVTWSAACFFEACSLILRRPVLFDRQKARDMYRTAWCCDSTLAMQEIGYEPRVSLTEGLRETALWYKQHGWL